MFLCWASHKTFTLTTTWTYSFFCLWWYISSSDLAETMWANWQDISLWYIRHHKTKTENPMNHLPCIPCSLYRPTKHLMSEPVIYLIFKISSYLKIFSFPFELSHRWHTMNISWQLRKRAWVCSFSVPPLYLCLFSLSYNH